MMKFPEFLEGSSNIFLIKGIQPKEASLELQFKLLILKNQLTAYLALYNDENCS